MYGNYMNERNKLSEESVTNEYGKIKMCKSQEIYNKNLDNMVQKVIKYDCMVSLGEMAAAKKTL